LSEKLITQEIGSFRKPEYLSTKFHALEGSDEYANLAQKATLETLKLFDRAGLQNIGVGGEMFRWEMYEHLAKRLENIEFYGLVRSFDNRYYKKGSVTGKLQTRESFHSEELEYVLKDTVKDLKVPITGAYTMMDWSFNEHYKDRRELAMAFADLIREEIKKLDEIWHKSGRKGKLQVQIDEPATTTHPSEMDIVVESMNRSMEGIKDIEFTLHVCYSKDYRILYDKIPEMGFHGYNLEYANRDSLDVNREIREGYEDLRYFRNVNDSIKDKTFIGLGVTDVHIDTVESEELIENRIKYALNILEEPKLVRVNPDCGLRTRSREIGFKKLENMVNACNKISDSF
jgi:5-methyltetrahydropteroyltriglutamate--homocysteine methyltransferase